MFVVVFNHMLCIVVSNQLLLAALLHKIDNTDALIDIQLFGKVHLEGLLGFRNSTIKTWWRTIFIARLTPVNGHGTPHLRERQLMMPEWENLFRFHIIGTVAFLIHTATFVTEERKWFWVSSIYKSMSKVGKLTAYPHDDVNVVRPTTRWSNHCQWRMPPLAQIPVWWARSMSCPV